MPKKLSKSKGVKTDFSLLKIEIKDEMQWLMNNFCANYPDINFTMWKNNHAEERYIILKERLKSLK